MFVSRTRCQAYNSRNQWLCYRTLLDIPSVRGDVALSFGNMYRTNFIIVLKRHCYCPIQYRLYFNVYLYIEQREGFYATGSGSICRKSASQITILTSKMHETKSFQLCSSKSAYSMSTTMCFCRRIVDGRCLRAWLMLITKIVLIPHDFQAPKSATDETTAIPNLLN
jgi:hypothetical protein